MKRAIDEVREAELLADEALSVFADALPAHVVEEVRRAMIEGLLCSEDGRAVLAQLGQFALAKRA